MANGPIVVRGALSKESCKIIEVYSLIMEKRSEIYHETSVIDKDLVGSYFSYADAMTESLLLFLKKDVENAVGLELLPTYSFYRVYRKGHELPKHTDRNACEVTASVCLANGHDGENWPLFIDGNPFYLNAGDMVVYKGAELVHWREPAKFDGYQVQAFIHYVDKNGQYSEWELDKRKSIFRKDREG